MGGEWVESDSGETFPVTDPATGEEIARVPRMYRGVEDGIRIAKDLWSRNEPSRPGESRAR